MITPMTFLADSPWRAAVLAELLEAGQARLGLTLVVALELHAEAPPFELVGLVRMNTPRPPEGDDADAVLGSLLAPRLASIARLYAPALPADVGRDDRAPTHQLVTIVCRDGDPTPGPAEEQFARAWSLAADRTSAHRGDVYVVTPQGWAGVQGGSGAEPVLVIDASSYLPDDDVIELPPLVDPAVLESDPAVVAAEEVLADALAADFDSLAAPSPRECLACYVTRMVGRFGCDGSWRFVEHYRVTVTPRAKGLRKQRWRREGECDCAVYELGYDLADDVEEPVEYGELGGVPVCFHHEWPWPNPPECRGVRRGAVKPCAVWQPYRDEAW